MANFDTNNLSHALMRPALLGPAALVVACVLYSLFLRTSPITKLYSTLPIVGARPGEWFPLLRARWRNGRNLKAALIAAHRDHDDEPCILPIQGAEDFVILPLRDIPWYVDQPDSIFNIKVTIRDLMQLDHTVFDQRLVVPPAEPHELVNRKLTREAGNVMDKILDEAGAAFEDLWGGGSDDGDKAKDVYVYATMQRAVGRVTNRVFVGLPLCRDERLLDAGIAYTVGMHAGAALLRLLWRPLRPLAALAVTLPGRLQTWRFCSVLREEIRRRIREYASGSSVEKGASHQPNDYLQWCIQQAAAQDDEYLGRVDTIAGRLLMINSAAIHTSSFSITHALLDLVHAGPVDGPRYVATLREEIAGSLARHGGVWDKRALADMPRLDSLLRESTRLNSFSTISTVRTVVAPGGATIPGGVHLPRGTHVTTDAYAIMHDGRRYPDPEAFRPFRFAERREAVGGAGGAPGAGDGAGYLERARQAFTTTSPEFLAFGHGRHACPGRFFASVELRLMLACVLMNYDLEFSGPGTRPRNRWFNVQRVPDMKATIRVRRRTRT